VCLCVLVNPWLMWAWVTEVDGGGLRATGSDIPKTCNTRKHIEEAHACPQRGRIRAT